MSAAYSIAVSILYSLACLGYGWLVAAPFARWGHQLRSTNDAALAVAALGSAFLLGTGFYAAILTVLGVAGLLLPTILAVSLAPGLLFFLVVATRHGFGLPVLGQALVAMRAQPWWLCMLAILLALTALGFAFAAWFTPPKGDAAAFYLVYPKIVAAAGALIPMPGTYLSFSQIGLSAEYHFAALMVLADLGAGKLFMFPVALALAAILAGLVRVCHGGTLAIVLSFAVLLTSSTVHLYIFDGKVDLLATGYGLAAAYWLVQRRDEGLASFALSGVFAGLSIVAKFSFIPSLGASLLVLLLWRAALRAQGQGIAGFFGALVPAGLVMGLTTLLGWLPQLLKNAVLFNAPLAPFIGGVDTGGGFLDQVWFSAAVTLQIVLTYPLALVYGRYPMQGGGLSPLLLCFLPLVLLARRRFDWRTNLAGMLALSGLLGLLAWVILRPSVIAPRYILASLLLLVPFVVIKVEHLLAERKGPAWLDFGVALSVLAAIAASSWQLLPVASAAVASLRGADRACLMASAECQPLMEVSALAQPGDRMLVATYYAYWLDASHLQCRDGAGELAEAIAAPDLALWMQERGFRYAVIDTAVFPQLADSLAALDGNAAETISSVDGGVATYRVLPGGQPNSACVNVGRDHWLVQEVTP